MNRKKKKKKKKILKMQATLRAGVRTWLFIIENCSFWEHCIVWKKWDRENESSQKKILYEEKKPLRENIYLFTWK